MSAAVGWSGASGSGLRGFWRQSLSPVKPGLAKVKKQSILWLLGILVGFGTVGAAVEVVAGPGSGQSEPRHIPR